jgi:glutamate dehydrogenase
MTALAPRIREWLRGGDREIVVKDAEDMVCHGVPTDLAASVAGCLYSYSLLDVIDMADIVERDPVEVADTYFALMGSLGIDGLLTAVSELPRNDRWHSLARLAIRDDIYSSLRALTLDVLAVGESDETGEEKIAEWEHMTGSRVMRARRTLTEIYQVDERDLAVLSVAARQIRAMTRASGTGVSGTGQSG